MRVCAHMCGCVHTCAGGRVSVSVCVCGGARVRTRACAQSRYNDSKSIAYQHFQVIKRRCKEAAGIKISDSRIWRVTVD